MTRNFTINGYEIGAGQPPFMIAEVSCNHMGSLERAKEIIRVSKQAGADAIKLQTYTADTMTINASQPHFWIDHPLWKNMSLYDLYAKAQTPFEWMKPLFDLGKEIGITVFSTPFDFTAVDLLTALDTPIFKIASFEAIHIPLIKKAAATGKPMIISTGMSNEQETEEAVQIARDNGCQDIVLLHCISSYPTPIDQANLKTIELLRNRFDVLVGLSDHTIDPLVSELAIGLGACMVEKHIMLHQNDDTFDKAFSITPEKFAELVSACKKQTPENFKRQLAESQAIRALGTASFDMKPGEKNSVVFRPSIMVARDIEPGEIFTPDNLIIRRPAAGLPPKYWDELMGKRAAVPLTRGDAMSWDKVEGATKYGTAR